MAYIGAGITRFNTADDLTVTDDAEIGGDLTVTGSADINGGAIDGVTIGGASAGAGTFTTLQADTSLNVDGTVTADGLTVDGSTTLNNSGATALTLQRNGGSDSNTSIVFNQDTADSYLGTDSSNSVVIGRNLNLLGNRIAKFDQSGDISFYEDTGTTPKLFWDASAESLGIGTSPTRNLTVFDAADSQMDIKTGTNTNVTEIYFSDSDNAGRGKVTYDHSNDFLSFDTLSQERMRITSSGQLFVNNTSASYGGQVVIKQTASAGESSLNCINTAGSGTMRQIDFYQGTSTTRVGSIESTTSSTSFNTSSDYRLKENIVDMTDAIDRVKALKPSRFNFIIDPDKTVDGFLAHEAQVVVPEAVSGDKDAMRTEKYEVTPAVLDDDGNVVTEAVMGTREVPDYQGIDQSKLVPLLTGALKEAIARIETLEAQVAALKGN